MANAAGWNQRFAEEGLLNSLCYLRSKYLPNDPACGKDLPDTLPIQAVRTVYLSLSEPREIYYILPASLRSGAYLLRLGMMVGETLTELSSLIAMGITGFQSRRTGIVQPHVCNYHNEQTKWCGSHLSCRSIWTVNRRWPFQIYGYQKRILSIYTIKRIQAWMTWRLRVTTPMRSHNPLPSCWTWASFQVWNTFSEGEAEFQAEWTLKHHGKCIW